MGNLHGVAPFPQNWSDVAGDRPIKFQLTGYGAPDQHFNLSVNDVRYRQIKLFDAPDSDDSFSEDEKEVQVDTTLHRNGFIRLNDVEVKQHREEIKEFSAESFHARAVVE